LSVAHTHTQNIHTHTQTYTLTGTDLLEDYARAQTSLEKIEKEWGLSLGARGLYLKLLSACYTASDSMSRLLSQDTVGASKWIIVATLLDKLDILVPQFDICVPAS
jgi:hypothetical protein